MFLRIVIPNAGLVSLVQVCVEDDHRLQRENFVHQFGQLRARLHVQVHLQGAAGELKQVLHLAAPGLGLPGVFGDARGEPADQQRGEHEGQQRDRVGGFSGGIEGRGAHGEVALHPDRRQRNDDRLPESAQQRGGNHDQQGKKSGYGEQPLEPVRQRPDENDRQNSQGALERKQERPQPGTARAASAESSTHGDVGSRQPVTILSHQMGARSIRTCEQESAYTVTPSMSEIETPACKGCDACLIGSFSP